MDKRNEARARRELKELLATDASTRGKISVRRRIRYLCSILGIPYYTVRAADL